MLIFYLFCVTMICRAIENNYTEMNSKELSHDNKNIVYQRVWEKIRLRVKTSIMKNGGKLGNLNVHFKLICFFSIVCSSVWIAWSTNIFWLSCLATIITGVFLLLLVINGAHDASHGVLFRSSWANTFYLISSFALLGIDGILWKLRHIQAHHRNTNVHNVDPDIMENIFLRLSPTHQYRSHFRWQAIYAPFLYLIALPHTFLVQDFEHLALRNLPYIKKIPNFKVAWLRALSLKLIPFVVFLFVPVIIFQFDLIKSFAVFFFSQVSASLFFVWTVSLNHFVVGTEFHKQEPGGNWFNRQRLASADWNGDSYFYVWWMGGANSHLAHHLFPGASHRHLVQISKIIYEECDSAGLSLLKFRFWEGVQSHYKLLNELGKGKSNLI